MVVTDITGAFLHANMNNKVQMLPEGTIAELIIKLEPKLYRNYKWKNKNDKLMLYVN